MSTTVSAAVSAAPRTLRGVKPGQTVTVTKLTGEGPLRRRIMDMGITKGASVYVRKVAPLGDPVRSPCGATSSPSARGTRKTSWLSEARAWVPAALPDWGGAGRPF